MSGSGPPPPARLILRRDPSRPLDLDPGRPFGIGRDPANRLSLPEEPSLSRRHAEILASPGEPVWLLRDLGSANGTFVAGARVRGSRRLADGDEIRLGRRGPVLIFRLEPPAASSPPARLPEQLEIAGSRIPLDRIRSVEVRSQPLHPHLFSWWLLAALGGLLLLPFPLLFWPWEAFALVVAVLLGARRRHTLLVVEHDGRAVRRAFANRHTALSHRNGIRRSIGQSPGT
jgi:hypothetical protein